MKHIFVFLIMAFLCFSLYATGQSDPNDGPEPIEFSVLYSGIGTYDKGTATEWTNVGWAFEQVKKDFPEAVMRGMQVDLSDGSQLTMTTFLAAGKAPNVYMDTLVRSSTYITPDFALPLDEYVRDLAKYPEDTLAPYRRNGDLLALPQPGSAQGMAINLDMMKDIGYEVPDNWTIADFLEMAELVKQKYNGEKWATGMFAGNQSGDYLINNWFAAFGCRYYDPGDYSHTVIRDTGGAQVHAFFQTLMKNGYIRQDAATQVDDDYVLDWARGNLAATAFFQSWTKHYFKVLIDNGEIKEPFEYKFVPFPRAEGVNRVPTYYMNGAIVVHKSGSAADPIAARFAEYLNGAKIQTAEVLLNSVLPTRTDVTAKPGDPWTAQIADIVAENGIFDVGLTNEKFGATRPQHYSILQKVLNLKNTPQESIAEYEKALNEALK